MKHMTSLLARFFNNFDDMWMENMLGVIVVKSQKLHQRRNINLKGWTHDQTLLACGCFQPLGRQSNQTKKWLQPMLTTTQATKCSKKHGLHFTQHSKHNACVSPGGEKNLYQLFLLSRSRFFLNFSLFQPRLLKSRPCNLAPPVSQRFRAVLGFPSLQ